MRATNRWPPGSLLHKVKASPFCLSFHACKSNFPFEFLLMAAMSKGASSKPASPSISASESSQARNWSKCNEYGGSTRPLVRLNHLGPALRNKLYQFAMRLPSFNEPVLESQRLLWNMSSDLGKRASASGVELWWAILIQDRHPIHAM